MSTPLVNVDADEVQPIGGEPAWMGRYQLKKGGAWLTARSGYGAILYTTREYAIAGATYCAMRELDRLNNQNENEFAQ